MNIMYGRKTFKLKLRLFLTKADTELFMMPELKFMSFHDTFVHQPNLSSNMQLPRLTFWDDVGKSALYKETKRCTAKGNQNAKSDLTLSSNKTTIKKKLHYEE